MSRAPPAENGCPHKGRPGYGRTKSYCDAKRVVDFGETLRHPNGLRTWRRDVWPWIVGVVGRFVRFAEPETQRRRVAGLGFKDSVQDPQQSLVHSTDTFSGYVEDGPLAAPGLKHGACIDQTCRKRSTCYADPDGFPCHIVGDKDEADSADATCNKGTGSRGADRQTEPSVTAEMLAGRGTVG